MRWFINYIRQCFCKHEFEYDEKSYCNTIVDEYGNEILKQPNIRVSVTCKKCGYHKGYFKFKSSNVYR
jgi:hypothetical protein